MLAMVMVVVTGTMGMIVPGVGVCVSHASESLNRFWGLDFRFQARYRRYRESLTRKNAAPDLELVAEVHALRLLLDFLIHPFLECFRRERGHQGLHLVMLIAAE